MDLEHYYTSLINLVSESKAGFLVNNKYIFAVVILLFSVIFAKLLLWIVKKYIIQLTKNTKTDLDDRLIEATHKPLYYILMLLGLHLALNVLGITNKVMAVLSKLIFSVMALVALVMLTRVGRIMIEFWSKVWTKRTKISLEHDVTPLLKKTTSVIFAIVGIIFILKYWGVDVTGFLAGVGIAGIAIGFAVKDSLANIFGGISLILDKNIKAGDKVKLESGEMGYISDIGLRSTKLLTFDNELIIIPNSTLANSRIQNYVLPDPKQRVRVNFGVEYGSDPDKVKKVVIDAVKNMDHVLTEPPVEVDFLEMGDSALLFVCKIWVDGFHNAYDVKVKATEKIYKALNKSKIGIPFPTRTVYLKKG